MLAQAKIMVCFIFELVGLMVKFQGSPPLPQAKSMWGWAFVQYALSYHFTHSHGRINHLFIWPLSYPPVKTFHFMDKLDQAKDLTFWEFHIKGWVEKFLRLSSFNEVLWERPHPWSQMNILDHGAHAPWNLTLSLHVILKRASRELEGPRRLLPPFKGEDFEQPRTNWPAPIRFTQIPPENIDHTNTLFSTPANVHMKDVVFQ